MPVRKRSDGPSPINVKKPKLEETDDDVSTTPSNEEEEEEEEEEEDEEEDDSDYESDPEQKLAEKDPEAYNALMDVREEIARTEPNIAAILKTPLRLEDRARLVQLYEIYQSEQPNTEEWLEARSTVNKTFCDMKVGYEHYMKYSSDEHAAMDKEVEGFSGFDSKAAMKYKILQLEASTETKEAIYQKYKEFLDLRPNDDEYGKLRNWLTWATEIPHDHRKAMRYDNLTEFLRGVSRKLDAELYGMEKVKEQLLIFLNAKILNPSMKKCNLGLVGAPGTGKTMIARLLADVMDYPLEQIACGGVSGPDFFRGHDFTYVGSGPGEIVKCLRRAGCKNMIMYLDEYEKVSDNEATCAALLGITDPSQNGSYRDLYLSDFTMDLGNVWFIKSMNEPPKDTALRDRIFIIQVPGYSFTDKVKIITGYVTPKACTNAGLTPNAISFSEDVAGHLISKVCSREDKGVRTMEKTITDLVNKVNFIKTHQDELGNLEGFKMSFDPKTKLEYPLTMTRVLLDKLIESKDIDMVMASMYL